MFVIWLTGPSGAGKTTLGKALKKELERQGHRVEFLDGDEIRHELYPNLGFSSEAREMHNRVVIKLAKTLEKHGVVVIVSLISPFKQIRKHARSQMNRFIEVYVNADLETRIKRDPKGLYKKALAGEIKGLTGLDGVYEVPENPEVVIKSDEMSVGEEVKAVLKAIESTKNEQPAPPQRT